MEKKKVQKIVVLICTIVVIAAIFVVKRFSNQPVTSNVEIPLYITEITLEEIRAYELPVIVDFGADSCIPCKQMAPVLVSLNEEMQGRAVVQFVDVWKYPEAAQDFPVQVIPTQVIFHSDGTPYVPPEDLGIPMTMYSTKDTGEHIFTVHEGGLTEEQLRLILVDLGVVE